MIKLTKVYKRTDKNGNDFLVGKLNERLDIILFSNQMKNEDNAHEYTVFIRDQESKDQRQKGSESVQDSTLFGLWKK